MPTTTLPAIAATRRFFRALGMTGAGFMSTTRHHGEIAANPHNRCGKEQDYEDAKYKSHNYRALPAPRHILGAERSVVHSSTDG